MKVVLYGPESETWATALASFPAVETVVYRDRETRREAFEDAEVLVGWRFPERLLGGLPKLRWIQLICVRVDEVLASAAIGSAVMITNAKGVYHEPVADYVMWAILTLSRALHRVLHNQSWRQWRQVPAGGVRGKTLGIVGVGDIGSALASRAKAFGINVVGVTRIADGRRWNSVDRCLPFRALHTLLPECDFLGLCVPLTDETRGMLDRRAIARLKPGAIVINVSSAELIDTAALVYALRHGILGGAALDVFSHEPLSRWSRLWRVPNLLVTPHVAALTTDYRTGVASLIRENVGRYCEGAPLRNVVDRSKGY